ncbi:MAG: hypothetical protein Fur0037_26840 [Planctomycetota bacterium]
MPCFFREAPFALCCVLGLVRAQDAIDDLDLENRITEACVALGAQEAFPPFAKLRQQGTTRRRFPLKLAPIRTAPLRGPELRDAVLRSSLIVGRCYRCPECGERHFDGSSGFALARNGIVATCAHLLEEDPQQPETVLAVADLGGRVWPVLEVLACDTVRDACILRIDAELSPLPLRCDVRAGEEVWLASNPDHCFGYFDRGVVARWYRYRPADSEAAKGPAPLWLQVTTPFGRGSSGGALVDDRGNCVGFAQSTETVVHDETAERPDVQMVFYNATPAEALRALVGPADGGPK